MSDKRKTPSAAKDRSRRSAKSGADRSLKSVKSKAVIAPSATPQENSSETDSKSKSKKPIEISDLPPEIRIKIWHNAVGPRIVQLKR